jgi:hypothetical protein
MGSPDGEPVLDQAAAADRLDDGRPMRRGQQQRNRLQTVKADLTRPAQPKPNESSVAHGFSFLFWISCSACASASSCISASSINALASFRRSGCSRWTARTRSRLEGRPALLTWVLPFLPTLCGQRAGARAGRDAMRQAHSTDCPQYSTASPRRSTPSGKASGKGLPAVEPPRSDMPNRPGQRDCEEEAP